MKKWIEKKEKEKNKKKKKNERKKISTAFFLQTLKIYSKSKFLFFSQATGSQLGLLAAAVVTTIGGLVVAFSATWQITLVMIAFLPLLLIAGMSFNTFMGGGEQKAGVSAGQVSYSQ